MTGNNKGGRVSFSGFDKKKNKNKIKKIAFAVAVIGLSLFAAGVVVFDKLFVVNNIEIHGNNEYTAEEAAIFGKEIGIEKGMHLFSFDREEKALEAKYRLSLFDSVSVSLSLPDTVVLNVKEAIPCFYISKNHEHYILSEELRVISRTENAADAEALALIKAEIGNIEKCIVGEFLAVDDDNAEIFKSLYDILAEEGVAADVSEIDTTDKFNINLQYKGRFAVKIGSKEDLVSKVRFMAAIEQKLKVDDSGYIDVSDETGREGTFLPFVRG